MQVRICSRHDRFSPITAALIFLTIFSATNKVFADDRLTRVSFLDANKQTRTVDGKILVEAVDGGILLLARDGRLWNVTPEQLKRRQPTQQTFEPLSADELGDQLQAELGDGFEIVKTRHYVIASGAGRKYAQWCGALFERLMSSFQTHFRTRQLRLAEPKWPLAAIVLANHRDFAQFAAKDAGPQAATAKGYYSVRTNRMVLYDLTAGPNSRPARTVADINRRISALPLNVATVVHEATHQIAFNCGMHTRLADNPLWLTEGMAMYFETPDLRSRSGWRTVGKVNRPRLRQFSDYLRRREHDSLLKLLAGDRRFSDADQIADTYAEAWALTYFLIKTKRKAYLTYLNGLSSKPQLIWDTPQKRLEEFKAAFGADLGKLDRDFVRYLQRLRIN